MSPGWTSSVQPSLGLAMLRPHYPQAVLQEAFGYWSVFDIFWATICVLSFLFFGGTALASPSSVMRWRLCPPSAQNFFGSPLTASPHFHSSRLRVFFIEIQLSFCIAGSLGHPARSSLVHGMARLLQLPSDTAIDNYYIFSLDFLHNTLVLQNEYIFIFLSYWIVIYCTSTLLTCYSICRCRVHGRRFILLPSYHLTSSYCIVFS